MIENLQIKSQINHRKYVSTKGIMHTRSSLSSKQDHNSIIIQTSAYAQHIYPDSPLSPGVIIGDHPRMSVVVSPTEEPGKASAKAPGERPPV
jgi:hypothetical protein